MSRRIAVPFRAKPVTRSGFLMILSSSSDSAIPESLRLRRERAERITNALRAAILVLLAFAAVAYSTVLSPELERANVMLLVPMLSWTVAQYLLWYRADRLPEWLPLTNAIVDVTAVTGIIAGYAIAGSGALALRSPIFIMYFIVLAARPVASSVRKTAVVATLLVAQYAILVFWLKATGRIAPVVNPMEAIPAGTISYLDEGAKVGLLAVAGAIATYGTIWVEGLVIESAKESAERQRVQTRLVQSQLDTLRLQLSPHFLFNALNSAMALIGVDAAAAERMLTAISDFLRTVLHSSTEPEVTVDQELGLLENYIEIQRVRFGDKLRVIFDIDDSLRSAMVPSLLLQPLVENSIRHGIGPRASGGTITVCVRAEEKDLCIEVVDDGIGPSARRSREKPRGSGLGLANTATRLNHLYGDRHRFETGPGKRGGFVVRVYLPIKFSDKPARGVRQMPEPESVMGA
ncbi:MAG TPA: histidine kinase [Gemmatimonadaceae bacterium]|nr:histidine kinase [Gemmatimonadaceae bacterium]